MGRPLRAIAIPVIFALLATLSAIGISAAGDEAVEATTLSADKPIALEVAAEGVTTTTTTTTTSTTTTSTTVAPTTTTVPTTLPPTTAAPATTVPPATTAPPPTTEAVANVGNCGGWQGLVEAHFPPAQVAKACSVLMCESNGNPTARNPSSTAAGLFQFLTSTHQAYGDTAYPTAADAPPASQVAAAARLYHARGWQPWVCA